MKNTYKINQIYKKEKWIFIQTEEWDEPNAFIALIKKIANSCDGTIKEVGDCQYKIIGDKYDLIYQWDTCFGFVIKYENSLHQIIKYLTQFFN